MSNATNSHYSDFATHFDSSTEDQFVHGNDRVSGTTIKLPTIVGWYHTLRAHYQIPAFQAIRFALWLGR